MKKLLVLLFLSLLMIGTVWGDTIFSESMGTVSATTAIAAHESANGFDNDSFTFSGTGDVRATYASTGYTGASGSANVMLSGVGKYMLIAGVNTSTYSALSLSFGIRKGASAETGSGISIQVSYDGTSWTNLTMPTFPTGSGTANWYYRTCSGTIPSTSTLYIKFLTSSTTEFRVDDILLTGTPVSSDPPPAPVASAASQIAHNSFTANWASSSGATKYYLDVATSDAFTGYYVSGYQDLDVGNVTSKVVSGLSELTTYFYRVRAFNTNGTSTSSNTIEVRTIATPVPSISVNPESLSDFSYVYGNGPSVSQSFTVSGVNLSNAISLTAPTNYEISLSSRSF